MRVSPHDGDDIENIIRKLKNNSGTGKDGLPAELFKPSGHVLAKKVSRTDNVD